MRIRNLLFLACLLATTILKANIDPASLLLTNLPAVEKDSCTTPPPMSFVLQEVGATWIKVAWGPVSPLDVHRIRTFRVSDNFLLNDTTFPPGTASATISPLPPNTNFRCEITAVCANGYEGPPKILTGTTLIIDLIAQYSGQIPNSNYQCPLIESGTCPISSYSNTVTGFRVIKADNSGTPRTFGMKITATGGNRYEIYLADLNGNDPSPFYFNCDNLLDPDPNPDCLGPSFIKLWDHSTNPATYVGKFTAITAYGYSYLSFSEGNTTYKIQRSVPTGLAPNIVNARGEHSPSTHPATASPNPFSETLDVFFTQNAAEQVSLQIFNLSGQKVLDKQFPGGKGQYSLSTNDLSPGFYLLRVEADGEVQTLKVVKSE